jgi:hypothetical protein
VSELGLQAEWVSGRPAFPNYSSAQLYPDWRANKARQPRRRPAMKQSTVPTKPFFLTREKILK